MGATECIGFIRAALVMCGFFCLTHGQTLVVKCFMSPAILIQKIDLLPGQRHVLPQGDPYQHAVHCKPMDEMMVV